MDIKQLEAFKAVAKSKGWNLDGETTPTGYIFYSAQTQLRWEGWQAKAQAVPKESKRQGGYYIRDLRNQPGNCMKFWYQDGYGTKHKNFFWCETLEQAKKYQGRCGWFEIWHAPYIDSLIEHTVDFQLADRNIGFVDLEAQEQKG